MRKTTSSPAKTGRPVDPRKQRAMLCAAQKHFLTYGLERSTMDGIAADAEVSKATLYAHYTSKEALFQHMIRAKCTEYTPPDFFHELHPLPPRKALERFSLNLMQLVLSPEVVALYRVIVSETGRNPQIGLLFYEAGPMNVKSYVVALLEHYKKNRLLKFQDGFMAVEMLGSMLLNEPHMRCIMGFAPAPNEKAMKKHAKFCVDIFLTYFGTKKLRATEART